MGRHLPNNRNYPNFGGFSQTFGVNAKILGFYTLGTHYSWGYPNFTELPKTCYLDVCYVKLHFLSGTPLHPEQDEPCFLAIIIFIFYLLLNLNPIGGSKLLTCPALCRIVNILWYCLAKFREPVSACRSSLLSILSKVLRRVSRSTNNIQFVS